MVSSGAIRKGLDTMALMTFLAMMTMMMMIMCLGLKQSNNRRISSRSARARSLLGLLALALALAVLPRAGPLSVAILTLLMVSAEIIGELVPGGP